MLNAVSQLGILMLLLLTGMETDLQLVKRVGRAAVTVTAAGVALPFICGFALGVSRRPGDTLFFGDTAASVLDGSDTSNLFVAS